MARPIGRGRTRAGNLECLAGELGLRHRVWFTGILDDVRPAYSVMDAYAFWPVMTLWVGHG